MDLQIGDPWNLYEALAIAARYAHARNLSEITCTLAYSRLWRGIIVAETD